MSVEKHLGWIVKAEVKTILHDEIYKLGAEILTGDLEGTRIYVGYRGSGFSHHENKPILIRLDRVQKGKGAINIDNFLDLDMLYAGYFLSSNIPEGFIGASSADVILYGKWIEEMGRDCKMPNYYDLTRLFDVGGGRRILYYAKKEDAVQPYDVKKDWPIRQVDKEDSTPMSIGAALYKYLRGIQTRCKPSTPRIVIYNEVINFKGLILSEFIRAIRKKLVLYCIEIQPQI